MVGIQADIGKGTLDQQKGRSGVKNAETRAYEPSTRDARSRILAFFRTHLADAKA